MFQVHLLWLCKLLEVDNFNIYFHAARSYKELTSVLS